MSNPEEWDGKFFVPEHPAYFDDAVDALDDDAFLKELMAHLALPVSERENHRGCIIYQGGPAIAPPDVVDERL
jgi:hypothetical protein